MRFKKEALWAGKSLLWLPLQFIENNHFHYLGARINSRRSAISPSLKWGHGKPLS